MKRVLLLGSGPAHWHLLHQLARRPLPGAEVLLLAPQALAVLPGLLPSLVSGHLPPARCTLPLPALARRAGVLWREGAVLSLDAAARRATLADGGVADFDILSLDLPALQARDRLPGAREHGLFLRPAEHLVPLLEGLWTLAQQRVLDVVVLGHDRGAVEMALALQARLGGRGAGGAERARVALVTGPEGPLPGHGAAMGQALLRTLKQRRVTLLREAAVAVDAQAVHLAQGTRLACDVPVIANGLVPPPWLAASGLALDETGRLQILPTLQSRSHAAVLAAGEVVAETSGAGAGPGSLTAAAAGKALARNLRLLLEGRPLQSLRPLQSPAAQQAAPAGLQWLACGDGRALAAWGRWALQGRALGWWLQRRGLRFSARPPSP